MRRALTSLLLAAAALAPALPLRAAVLDDFTDAAPWRATGSDQVRAAVRRDASDGSLCLDYDFGGVSGYAVMQRALPLDWPAHFDLQLRLKGSGATNDVQIKFVDASGENVWWVRRANAALPSDLTDWNLRARHVEFAWGPARDRTLRRTQTVELVVAAGRDGGRGSLCAARLALAERAPDPSPWPAPQVGVRDGALELDFRHVREFNGVALRWPAGTARPLDYELHGSDDGRQWRLLRRVQGSDGGLDPLYLPESQARWLRLVRPGTAAGAWPRLTLRDAKQWPDFNAALAEAARDAPAGHLPRSLRGLQTYWALVGVDGGGDRSALLSEDGAVELGRGGPSVEPAVQVDGGRAITWADVQLRHTLREHYLPQPAVHWRHADFTLDVDSAADGPRDAPQILVRYTLTNRSPRARTFTLALALRPWQVNPPQQFLNTPGGASPLRRLAYEGGVLAIDGRAALRATETPLRVSALPLDGGLSLPALAAAPLLTRLEDPQGHASALLQFRVRLAPGEQHTIGWVAPLGLQGGALADADAEALTARIDAAALVWRERLNRTVLDLPPQAQPLADTLRSALAQILVSRDGPALKPGTRSYARSWVRDGAMMAAGLVRLGELQAAREFVDWFAGFVFASGKVPCCVDARGADPVAENDSHGQYVFAVAEVWRHGGGRAFLEHHWPTVQRVVAYQEQLRQSERTDANRAPGRTHYFGLLPPSISHEGYSDKPAYSYWDDFWALRGYKDAVAIATTLGHDAVAQRWAAWRDEFERELAASVQAAATHHRIDFIPGAADRGDFDATSTTVALNPAQAALPEALLRATFERYWQQASARSAGRLAWKDYTPYELRNVGALARLGQPDRAHAMLDFFLRDRRPAGWNQWAEVVRPGYRERGFIGDMPHAWVASDYLRAVLDLMAYEQESDDSLVIGAGWHPQWMSHGLAVRGLSTAYGTLSYRLDPAAGGWHFTLEGSVPAARGGLWLHWPGDGALPLAQADGRTLSWQGRRLALPATAGTLTLTQRR